MIVKCIKNLQIFQDSWVEVGNNYQAFALRHRIDRPDAQRLECLVVSESQYGIAMEDMNQFEIVSDYIPSNWSIGRDENNWICMMPRNWFPLAKPEYLWEMVEYFSWNPKHEVEESDAWFLDEANKIVLEEKEYVARNPGAQGSKEWFWSADKT